MYFKRTLHMCSGNVRPRARTATRLKIGSFCILLVLILGLASEPGFATQATSSSGTRADINKEAQAAYRAGTTAATNNDLKTAEAQFEKVVRLVPQIEEGHLALGAVLMRLGKFPQAIKELEKALALKPGDLPAQIDLALAYEQTGADKKAVFLFERIEVEARRKPASDPSHTLPSFVLAAYARSLAATDQLPAAIAKMKAAVAESPQNAELRDDLGSLHAQQQSWLSAVSEFQQAIKLNPQFAAAHMHLGVVLLMQQQVSAAIPELIEASQLAPNSAV